MACSQFNDVMTNLTALFASRSTYYWCAGLPVNTSTPTHECYISNTHTSMTVENQAHIHMMFLTTNGLKNKILKY